MRRFLALATVLLVAGCDASDPVASGFEATVRSGAEVRAVSGSATAGDSFGGRFAIYDDLGFEDLQVTAIVLDADDADFHLVLGGLTTGALAAGTYGLSFAPFDGPDDAPADGFLVLGFEGDPAAGVPSLLIGTDGTVRIASVDGEQIVGSFRVETETFGEGAMEPQPGPVIEGTFTAAAGLEAR